MNSNTKGSSGEREFTAYLAHNFNIETERLLGQAREGGCDVKHYPFAFEVKRREFGFALMVDSSFESSQGFEKERSHGQQVRMETYCCI